MRFSQGIRLSTAWSAAALLASCASGGEQGSGVGSQSAALSGSTFESSDGNLVVNISGNTDWANAPNLVIKPDAPSGKTDDAYGQGTKEDTAVPSVVSGSIPPQKSDLTRFYVASESVGSNTYLYLAWERSNVLGSANMDFEFNQSATLSANGVTPVRTAGDILITYDFGGSSVDLGLLKWVDSTNGSAGDCYSASALPCWGFPGNPAHRVDLSSAGFAEGAINTVTVTDPQNNNASLPADTFGEAAINLTAANVLPAGTCVAFSGAHLNSRSSSSFTAEMKDFIAPVHVNVNNCQPEVINVRKVDSRSCTGSGPTLACTTNLGGAHFALFLDTNGNHTLDPGVDTQVGSECISDATTGLCSFSVNGNGYYIVHETQPPTGYLAAPDQGVSVTVTASVQTVNLTFQDSPQPGTINILKKDDAGNPVGGSVFTLYSDPGAAGCPLSAGDTAITTCTTSSAGSCSFTSVPTGTYVVVETSTPTGYFISNPSCQPVTVQVVSGGDVENLTYINAQKFHAIVIVCRTADNTLHPSSVQIDAQTSQMSISSSQAAALGLSDSALCGLSAGTFPNLTAGSGAAGDHTGSLHINP